MQVESCAHEFATQRLGVSTARQAAAEGFSFEISFARPTTSIPKVRDKHIVCDFYIFERLGFEFGGDRVFVCVCMCLFILFGGRCVCVCMCFVGFLCVGKGSQMWQTLCLHFRMPLSWESKGLIKRLLTIGFP